MTEYTKPKLREKLKQEIQSSNKGGRPGQWSARKAQLLAQEYRKQGGGYSGGKDRRSKAIDKWTEQDWKTREGRGKADSGGSMKRYLPQRAWDLLSEEQKRETESKKQRTDEQYEANSPAARAARTMVDKGDATGLDRDQMQRLTLRELQELARREHIRGRSGMKKASLAQALHQAYRTR